MMRALETAAGVFGLPHLPQTIVPPPDEEDGMDLGAPLPDQLLMRAQTGEPNVRAEHAALYLPPGVAFVAHELCRERLGPSHCDQRRAVSEAGAAFPGVDFSLIESDADELWSPGLVEGEGQVVKRGMKFLQVGRRRAARVSGCWS